MSWFNVLKFDTDEDITDLYIELYRKIDAGYKKFRRSTPYPWGSKNEPHSFNARLSALGKVIADKEYDDEDTFSYVYKQISKLEDYMDDWPHNDSLTQDINDTLRRFTAAMKRKINFISGNV